MERIEGTPPSRALNGSIFQGFRFGHGHFQTDICQPDGWIGIESKEGEGVRRVGWVCNRYLTYQLLEAGGSSCTESAQLLTSPAFFIFNNRRLWAELTLYVGTPSLTLFDIDIDSQVFFLTVWDLICVPTAENIQSYLSNCMEGMAHRAALLKQ